MINKTVLVVGGSGGVGSATISLLNKNGYHVFGTYCNKKPLVIDDQRDSFYKMDLLDKKSVESAIHGILKVSKHIDTIVYTVSSNIQNSSVFSVDWADFQDHIDLQTRGLFYLIKCLQKQIKEKYPTKFIIILTEYCLGKPPPGISPYITAKYSLMGFTKTLVSELSKYSCTFNMISPGMIETSLINNLPAKLIELTAQSNPLKRIAIPNDIAHAVLFLIDSNSDYINGTNIIVNGGNILS